MDHITIITDIRNNPFRPVGAVRLSILKQFVKEELKRDQNLEQIVEEVASMNQGEFRDALFTEFFEPQTRIHSFYSACLIIRAGKVEENSTYRIPKNFNWIRYANLSGRYSVSDYFIGDDFLAVRFSSGGIYVYSYPKTGFMGTEYMKACATGGEGLGHCTGKYFRGSAAFDRIA